VVYVYNNGNLIDESESENHLLGVGQWVTIGKERYFIREVKHKFIDGVLSSYLFVMSEFDIDRSSRNHNSNMEYLENFKC